MSWVQIPLAAPNTPSPQQGCEFRATVFVRASSRSFRLPRTPSATAAPPHLFCGTSGWAYPSWKPGFFPADVPARRFLAFYATRLNSVEVNYTFRTLPTPGQIATWLAAVPDGFRFSFKAPQRITHMKRLRDCEDPLREFFSALEPVRKAGKLGLVLFQLPPNFKADPERLRAFLALPPLRGARAPHVAFEFRHESWFSEETYAVLRERKAALCVAETEDLTTPDVVTTVTHRCYRLRHPGGYTARQLSALAKRFEALDTDTFVYFKHEDEPTGALNATALLARLSKPAPKSAKVNRA